MNYCLKLLFKTPDNLCEKDAQGTRRHGWEMFLCFND